MPHDINHILVSYDISDDRRLLNIAKVMKNYGSRVLRSVFECNVTKARYYEMKQKAESIINPLEDSIRFYFLCGKCVKNVEKIGKGKKFTQDKETLII